MYSFKGSSILKPLGRKRRTLFCKINRMNPITLNKLPITLAGNSSTGDGHITAAPFVTADGVPKAVLYIRLDVPSVYEATLDGHPALAMFIDQAKADGTQDIPWILGHELGHALDLAKQNAAGLKK